MHVSSSYDQGIISGIDAISEKKYSRVQNITSPSGDTVDISDEAKQLYSRMIHKYDKGAASGEAQTSAADSGGSQTGEGLQGGGGGSDDSSIQKIKDQIQSLKSQISSLASRAGSGDVTVNTQISALEAQIAALEAQLNEMAA